MTRRENTALEGAAVELDIPKLVERTLALHQHVSKTRSDYFLKIVFVDEHQRRGQAVAVIAQIVWQPRADALEQGRELGQLVRPDLASEGG